jgi:predicted NUDIX family NTP pyrophosphohydrolase
MEWPPRSGLQQTFPEVDRAAWFPIEEAKKRILKGQVALLIELQRLLPTLSTSGRGKGEGDGTDGAHD